MIAQFGGALQQLPAGLQQLCPLLLLSLLFFRGRFGIGERGLECQPFGSAFSLLGRGGNDGAVLCLLQCMPLGERSRVNLDAILKRLSLLPNRLRDPSRVPR